MYVPPSLSTLFQYEMHFSLHSHPLNLGAFRIPASDCNRGDPTLYGFSVLHVACCYGQPTEELLRMLLQFDSSQTKMREHQLPKKGHNPLGRLCRRGLSTNLVKCLLDVDNSVQVDAQPLICFQHPILILPLNYLNLYYSNPNPYLNLILLSPYQVVGGAMKGALYALALNQCSIDKEKGQDKDKGLAEEKDENEGSDNVKGKDKDISSLTEDEEASLARIDMLLKSNPEVATKYQDSNGAWVVRVRVIHLLP